MQSHSRAHHSLHPHWDPANVTITILVTLLFLVFLFLFLTLAATPALGQNHVPPTAAQAAKMPQFASRLAHPIRMGRPDVPGAPGFGALGWRPENASSLPLQQRATYRNPNDAHKRYGRSGPLDSGEIYNNGPINGTVDAWTINFGFIVSDTFTSQGPSTPNALKFAAWLFPGDILETAEVSITSSEFGGTTYFDGVVNFTQSDCTSNQFGFDVCLESGTFPDVQLNSGTYWINLQNAVVNTGDPVYWDENSGPSAASENSIGTIPSESFTVLGGTSTTTTSHNDFACPAPQPGFHDLHDIPAPTSGVTIDAAGNLYGSQSGGAHGEGMLYKLAHGARNWFLTTLYSFTGGDDGAGPGQVIVGPDGELYGSATGGIQSCGSDGHSYCGVIFKASSTPCRRASCNENETILYQFTGNSDAWGGTVSAFDSAGNLYGFSNSGGASGVGAIFKLSPSQSGWTETLIHTFRGTFDGMYPTSLLVSRDGNLYGTTAYGGLFQYGVVFRLTPSQSGWAESVLYAFRNGDDSNLDGYSPAGLAQDSSGILYGYSHCDDTENRSCYGGIYGGTYSLVFVLYPPDWTFSLFYSTAWDACPEYYDVIHALYVDPSGAFYTAEGGFDIDFGYNCGRIKSGVGVLIDGKADIFYNVTADGSGRVFGTVGFCGGLGTPIRWKSGMVWEYTPQQQGP